jgi:type I restriction enzyme S subunit
MTPLRNEQALDMQGHSDDPPEGWVSAKLPEIAHINMGQSPPGRSYNKRGDGLPFFQGKVDFGYRYPTVRVWCSQPKKIAHPGDVFISVRAPVGPTNVADHVCAIGRGLAAITPLGGIPSEFIFFRLRLLEPKLALSGTGSTFSAISRKDLKEIDIDVPPLAEQKRIVGKVEELLPRVNAAKERLAKVWVILKRFRQAVLAAACSGRLTADGDPHKRSLNQQTTL